ncbi:MAG: bifunctional phosphoribosylaminoimidazolecarboxamide formyltransferase/IMP cyclohydrolase [Firmicutes bacterium]|nr:bifunctional phosphoribosylaminoimidazolecarboxamide formyltransferase/IMP cyclohydrolase [Bacillota bacterium]
MATALLSVFDKEGLLPLAQGLRELGWHLLATGGTLKALREAGLEAQEVADYTAAPECFGGRVKTLHPRIHGGLLFRRDEAAHVADAQRLNIAPIDLVVVNLYPFEATVAAGASFEETIEQIDIGGPSMLRSAAKNHASVTVLTHPDQYEAFLQKQRAGTWSEADRRACARRVFQLTAGYDGAIAAWFAKQDEVPAALPASISLSLRQEQSLRYGENPHQGAAFYRNSSAAQEGLAACRQLQGKELSFNNLLDADAAARLAWAFEEKACVIVKHNNPCGAACADTPLEAFQKALASDPVSAFGGIVAFNGPVDEATAQALAPTFWEVILAPHFSDEALAILAAKKALRLLVTPKGWPSTLDLRSVSGGFLAQEPDLAFAPFEQWELKVEGQGPQPSKRDLVLAQQVAKAVKSNAIVLVKEGGTVGVGAGQMSRVDSVEIACRKAGSRAQGAVLGSDAFFPFADGLEVAAQAGVRAFVEPGGSVRDEDVIAAARQQGVWLYFTGMRHFRH